MTPVHCVTKIYWAVVTKRVKKQTNYKPTLLRGRSRTSSPIISDFLCTGLLDIL
jgi:hypothetical protein